jgi:uncharacterized lipoprotein YbaY
MMSVAATCGSWNTCFAQSSWMDYSRAALPKVNVPNTNMYPGMNQTVPNSPSNMQYTNPNVATSPMLVPNRKDWKIGVYLQNTDVGAIVTSVAPGSAGEQAGLEPNDIIVAVAGSRIGNFDNRIVELADEVRRNADQSGRVSLLVLDNRQRTLRSLPISMNSTSTALTGAVATRDRTSLPFGATLTVKLQNVSQPFYEIAGGNAVVRADGAGPYNYELNCDPRYIDPRNQYQLNAVITYNNQTLYSMRQPQPVNVANLGQPINLLLDRASSSAFDNNGFNGNTPGSAGNGFPNSQGNVVNVGYPGTLDTNEMQKLFLELINRAPSQKEVYAWQAYLQQGNSIDDLKAKLLSSSQYREKFPNEAAYIQQLIFTISRRQPTQQDMSYWMGRLQATGSPEAVVNEMLLKNR